MTTQAIARRPKSNPKPRKRNASRDENPGMLGTTGVVIVSALAGATAGHLIGKHLAKKKLSGTYSGVTWTVTPVNGGATWTVARGGTQLAGGNAGSVGEAMGFAGEALDVAMSV